MPRKAKELDALAVSNLSSPGLHSVGGVAGLALQITPGGSRSWILRLRVFRKRRDMGLGGYPEVSLETARALARVARVAAKSGIDPVEARRSSPGLAGFFSWLALSDGDVMPLG